MQHFKYKTLETLCACQQKITQIYYSYLNLVSNVLSTGMIDVRHVHEGTHDILIEPIIEVTARLFVFAFSNVADKKMKEILDINAINQVKK